MVFCRSVLTDSNSTGFVLLLLLLLVVMMMTHASLEHHNRCHHRLIGCDDVICRG